MIHKTRKKTSKITPSTPTKRIICGHPEILDSRVNPSVLSLDETDDYDQPRLIKDFLDLSSTQIGDIVTYSPPNQEGMWSATVQNNNLGHKCLGKYEYPNDLYYSSSESDNNGYESNSSYLSDSFGGKKHKSKKHKSKKHKSKKHKSKKHKSKKHKSKKHKSKKHKTKK